MKSKCDSKNVVLQVENASIAREKPNHSLSPFLAQKWAGALAVPRTHQTHCVQTSGRDKLMVADTSDATEFRIVRTKKVSRRTRIRTTRIQ